MELTAVNKRLVLNVSIALLGLATLLTLPGQATAGRSILPASHRGPYVPAVLPDPADWPMYGHDPQRTNYNPAETTINAGNVNALVERWRAYLGNNSPTSGAPDVSNGVVFAGSSVTTGNNYFTYDAVTGAPGWSTTVGHGNNCFSTGIGSTAVISGSVLSVGGGDAAYYGLDATNGAQLWREPMNVGTSGFPWSSPILAYGRSYLGMASCADNPSVRGEVRSVDMNVGGQLANQYFVPSGQRGAGIWNSPALSPDGSLLVVTTGEDYGGYNGPYNRAIVSLDPISLDILQSNQQGTTGGDVDYATTPLFFSDSLGRTLVGAIHKNGNFYAFAADNINGGPIWPRSVGYSAGMMPAYDPTFGSGGTLFVSNGSRVYAFNPNDGTDRWPFITSSSLHGNLAVANGLLFLNRGGLLEIRDETNGTLLRTITPTITGSTYTGPIVSHGFVYWLSGGWLNAWSLPATGTPSPTDTALSGTDTPTWTPTATPTDTYTPGPSPSATPTCQVYNYSLSAGTMISGTYDIGNHCDICATVITLPFTVNLYGQGFTTAQAGSKGYLAFGTAYRPFDVRCLPFSSATYVMAPFWVDQYTAQTECTSCGIYTATIGTAPNRTFIVEYRTLYAFQHTTSPTLDYEIQLHEGQSTFTYVYGLITSYANTDSALTIGVQKSVASNIYTRYYCDSTGHTPPPLAGQQLAWTYTPCTTATVNPTSTATATATTTAGAAATHTAIPTATRTATRPVTSVPTSTGTFTPTPVTPTPVASTPTSCPIQFTDVPEGSTFYSYIRCLACRGIVSGYSDGTFRPNNNVTRGQLSKIVSNSAGFGDPPSGQLFEDVAPSSTFYVFIQRLASRGYINGYPCGSTGEPCNPPDNRPYFRPNGNATRGQLAKIVSNAAGFGGSPGPQLFEDVPPGSTFYTYTQMLGSRNIINGYPCGGTGEPCNPPDNLPYFRTYNNSTRGQTAKIVANTFFPDCQTPLRR